MADEDWQSKVRSFFKFDTLTENQQRSIEAVKNGKDVFVGTSTGSGKSLTYQAIPIISDNKIVVIVAPLLTIMEEQCGKLNKMGFKATFLGKDKSENELIENGHFDFVFGSPELLVGEKRWRDMMRNDVYQSRLGTFVVDEAHTVIQWGEKKAGSDPFRKWFSKIGELRSLCPQANLVALTATAGPTQRRHLMKVLSFRHHNCIVIVDSPDRQNIKIHTKCIPNKAESRESMEWLIKWLKRDTVDTPRHVVFCRTIADCARVYISFAEKLGRNSPWFNMYHSKTKEPIKEKIREKMASDSDLRVLICTNAAGMGVNFVQVNNIVHFGLPFEMDTFVQQMGRAGRDGSVAHEVIMYKSHKGQLKKVDSELVQLAKDSKCRHAMLCQSYSSKLEDISPKHRCCDVCAAACDCGSDECPEVHAAVSYEIEEEPESDPFKRDVSDDNKNVLRHKLRSYMFHLYSTHTTIDPAIVYGINEDVIQMIIQKSEVILNVDDVLRHIPIWSYQCAKEICGIINDVFGDEEMYDFQKDMHYRESESESDSDDSTEFDVTDM